VKDKLYNNIIYLAFCSSSQENYFEGAGLRKKGGVCEKRNLAKKGFHPLSGEEFWGRAGSFASALFGEKPKGEKPCSVAPGSRSDASIAVDTAWFPATRPMGVTLSALMNAGLAPEPDPCG
jgi:hypothetical protein